jgi:hypothetical protein
LGEPTPTLIPSPFLSEVLSLVDTLSPKEKLEYEPRDADLVVKTFLKNFSLYFEGSSPTKDP